MAEQQLPEEWELIALEQLGAHVIGGDWGQEPNYPDEGYSNVYCIRGTEFKTWRQEKGATAVSRKVKNSSLETRKLKIGDILIEISGGGPEQPVGRTVLIDEDVISKFSAPIVCTNFLRLFRPTESVDSKFLIRYLEKFYLSGEISTYQGGSNNLRNLKFKEYSAISIPLPPLAEQQVIADTLDRLLAQVERSKARLQRIPQLLKRFRQSVLAAAVSGKLTEEWRGSPSIRYESAVMTIGLKNSDNPLKWSWNKLTDVAILESGHTPRKTVPEYWENGDIPWISLQDIRAANGKVIDKTKNMPTMCGINNSSARLLPTGTVCFSRDISVGYVTIMGREMATTQHFANWVCSDKLNNRYLMYSFMASRDYLTISGQGTTVKTIYMPALKELMLCLPPIEEQTEIVRRVEQLFAYADRIEQQAQAALARVNRLTQAILAKAFRGELTEQWRRDNPHLISGDHSATALLARIQAERAKAPAKGRGRKSNSEATSA